MDPSALLGAFGDAAVEMHGTGLMDTRGDENSRLFWHRGSRAGCVHQIMLEADAFQPASGGAVEHPVGLKNSHVHVSELRWRRVVCLSWYQEAGPPTSVMVLYS